MSRTVVDEARPDSRPGASGDDADRGDGQRRGAEDHDDTP